MSHTYLLDLYELIDQRMADVGVESGSDGMEGERATFQQGQYDVLQEFKQFLVEHYNSKLPRCIRNSYSG